MKVEILKEKNVPLMNRKRVSVMVDFEGGATPSILVIRNEVARKLKEKPELVAIKHVYQRYGVSKAKVLAHIYKSRKDLLHLEKLKKAEKKAIEAAKKEAEEKAKVEAEEKTKAELETEEKKEQDGKEESKK